MRRDDEVLSLILNVAKANRYIRAVLLTGSRVNPAVIKDGLQDFDIIYIVTDINPFIKDHSWIDVFGERLILQLPAEMTIGEQDASVFHYLMLFADGNRIDLTLFPINNLNELLQEETLLQLLLDKDDLIKDLPPSSDRKYLIKSPLEKQFTDCCNEFWWVSTYVVKGLCRKEVLSAKAILEGPLRTMFLQVIEWYIGVNTSFEVPFGKNGRNMQRYLSPQLYEKIVATYPDGDIANIWTALLLMTALFNELAIEVARKVNFIYNETEARNVSGYLRKMHDLYTNT